MDVDQANDTLLEAQVLVGDWRHEYNEYRPHRALGMLTELVGQKANGGREYQPKQSPRTGGRARLPDSEMGKAVPYGVHDVGSDEGWISLGDDHDTAAFAVNALRRWWQVMGAGRYPQAKRLMVTADAGGSNSYRNRSWKIELGRLAAETGVEITVCHYPPGTSKWNKIEHRLFSFITKNWRSRPLTSYRAIVELVSATTTKTGLKVLAGWDQGDDPPASRSARRTRRRAAGPPQLARTMELHDPPKATKTKTTITLN